jgi:serine/threonine protein kinase
MSLSTNETGETSSSKYDCTKNSKWQTLSKSVKILILCMTDPDPRKRLSISELLRSEWLSAPLPEDCS